MTRTTLLRRTDENPSPLGVSRLSANLVRRLRAGEHLLLWGPTGSGKTTLLAAVEERLRGRACARCEHTRSLDDMTLWIVECCALARDPSYWRDNALRVGPLTWDTEIRLRTSRRPIESRRLP